MNKGQHPGPALTVQSQSQLQPSPHHHQQPYPPQQPVVQFKQPPSTTPVAQLTSVAVNTFDTKKLGIAAIIYGAVVTFFAIFLFWPATIGSAMGIGFAIKAINKDSMGESDDAKKFVKWSFSATTISLSTCVVYVVVIAVVITSY